MNAKKPDRTTRGALVFLLISVILAIWLWRYVWIEHYSPPDLTPYTSHLGQPLSTVQSQIPKTSHRVKKGDDGFPISGYGQPQVHVDFAYVIIWRYKADQMVYLYVDSKNRIQGVEVVGS